MIRWTWAIAFMTACVYDPPVDGQDQDTDDDSTDEPDPSERSAACFGTGTLLCLEFETGAGMLKDLALDGSGNEFDATTNNVVTYQRLMTPTVDDADAAGFSALASTMTIADDLGLTGSVTLEMWAQTAGPATLFDSSGRLYLKRTSDDKLECGINGGSEDQRVDGGTSLDGNWHHVACVFDASTGDIKVFVDGEVDDCKRLDGRSIQAHAGSTALNAGLLGALDAVRVYPVALPGTELCKSAGRSGCNEICPIEGGFNGGGGFGGGGFGGGGD